MRENGYYWVLCDNITGWEIMEWYDNSFMKIGDEFSTYTDSDLKEINELPILSHTERVPNCKYI
jgi:hypothetical protein